MIIELYFEIQKKNKKSKVLAEKPDVRKNISVIES